MEARDLAWTFGLIVVLPMCPKHREPKGSFWGYREERAAKVVRVREGAAVFLPSRTTA